MDYVVLSYIALIGLLLIPFHRNVDHWIQYPILHLFAIILIFELIRANARHPHKLLNLLRAFYPFIGLMFAWKEIGQLINMIFPFWLNPYVLKWDLALFHVHPTVWVQQYFNFWTVEIMNFFYTSYYFFIPIATFPLIFKNETEKIMNILFISMMAYTVSYLFFIFLPAEGPHHIIGQLHTVKPKGGFFLALNRSLQSQSGIHGGCIPSSHICGSTATLFASYRYHRRAFWILLPLSIGMIFATVFCQYHHAVDGIAGLVISSTVFFIGIKILKNHPKR